LMYTIEVKPLCVELGCIKIVGKEEFILRRFQENIIDFFKDTRSYLFLSAPTGSGKTFTLLAPLLSNILYGTKYDGALGIYPTKPLTVDQLESLKFILGKLGDTETDEHHVTIYELDIEVFKGNEKVNRYRGKIGLVLLTRDNIEKLRGSLAMESGRSVLDAIRKVLLTENVDYLITFAVPEYPYLMLSHMYRSHHDLAKILDIASSREFVYRAVSKMLSLMNDEDKLRSYSEYIIRHVKLLVGERGAERELADISSALLPSVLFFDEFHTWSFYELPTAIALVLLHRLVSLTSTRREMYRVVFSSATPNQQVLYIIEKIAGESSMEKIVVEPVDCDSGSVVKVKGKTTVELYPVKTRLTGPIAWFETDSHLPQVVDVKASEIENYKRVIVLGRRIWSVVEAAKEFHKRTGKTPVVVTGVAPPLDFHGRDALVERKTNGELYVFGNYAVELGVDLQNIYYSIVIASNLGELVQRMGRSGRGGVDSKIVVPVPNAYLSEIVKKLRGKNTISYSELIEFFSWIMPYEHIVKALGNKTAMAWNINKLRAYLPLATHVLVLLLRYRDKPMDLKPVLQDFVNMAGMLGIDDQFFSWLSNKVSRNREVLVELASFRLSPSVPYARYGSKEQVDGEANPITLFSNYDVDLDGTGKFRVIIKEPMQKAVRDVAVIEMIHPPTNSLLSSLNDAVIPFRLLLDILIKSRKSPKRSRLLSDPLIKVLEAMNVPIYFIYARENTVDTNRIRLLEILHVYGLTLALKCSGEAYAYMLLL